MSERPEPPDRYLGGLVPAQRLALLYARLRDLDAARKGWPDVAAERAGDPRAVEARLRERAHAARLETALQRALAKADAELLSCAEQTGAGGGLVVEWRERGRTHRYRSVVSPELTVVASGICLGGQEQAFDLTSLVNVMTDRPEWMRDEEPWPEEGE